MPKLTLTVNVNGMGGSIVQSVPRTCDGGSSLEVTLPAGKTGQLTTRTSGTAGTLTMTGGHGITTGAKIDIYWASGIAYSATVGTVSTNSVPFTLASGDALPTNLTAIVACVQVPINVAIDGDNVALLAIMQKYTSQSETAHSHIQFLDVTPTEVAELDLLANTPQVFDIAGGSDNPVTGNPITSAVASNGSVTNAATLQIYFVQDTTP